MGKEMLKMQFNTKETFIWAILTLKETLLATFPPCSLWRSPNSATDS